MGFVAGEKMSKSMKVKLSIVLLVPLIMLLNTISKRYPQFIETYYSSLLNKVIIRVLSLITEIFPFSLAEFFVFTLIIILIILFIVILFSIRKKKFIQSVINLAAYLSLLYILFMFLWGFNYNRLSFDKIAGLTVEKSSKEELYALCRSLIERANTLRNEIHENDNGIMSLENGYKDVFRRAQAGYDEAARTYSKLGGKYGTPKKILLSPKMSYTGITGIYIPYTAEANVNINITDMMLPCTVAHEMAHQRGFAREDEANYIAYLTCSSHPDKDFQYSGVMLALIYSTNALASVDRESYKQLAKEYSAGVKRDLQYDYEFWQKYEGKVEEISNNVNNTYLKSNGQQDGVRSYGRMVDLLLAEYKSKH
jgi:hypothetical protein